MFARIDMDNNNKLLTTLIYVVSIATLLLIFCMGIMHYNTKSELMQMKNSIKKVEESSKAIPKPKDGYTPIKDIDYFDGQDGKNGKDSVSTHTETVTVKETPAKDGKDGKDGKPGLTPEIYIDRESCLFMTRYKVDESWEIQAQLPKPCEVQ